jgi:DNA-binding CsgD family transcriptional regulator
MSLALLVSIISAVVALGSALITAMLGARAGKQQLELTAEIERQGEARRRREQRDDLMSRIRDPLLQAASDLQMRIFNIVDQNFLSAFAKHGSAEERTYAERSTVFLFAQYMGWVEIARRSIQFLDLGNNKDNRAFVYCFSGATGILSSDSFTHDSLNTTPDSLFRVFRSDQRAIGEIMIAANQNDDAECVGYAGFCARLDSDEVFSRWLSHLFSSVTELAQGNPAHPRLIALQHNLIDLIGILDPGGLRFPDRYLNKLRHNPLTRTEIEMLEALSMSRSLDEVAGQLGMTKGSAEYRLRTLLQKFGVRSEAEAIERARQKGWL